MQPSQNPATGSSAWHSPMPVREWALPRTCGSGARSGLRLAGRLPLRGGLPGILPFGFQTMLNCADSRQAYSASGSVQKFSRIRILRLREHIAGSLIRRVRGDLMSRVGRPPESMSSSLDGHLWGAWPAGEVSAALMAAVLAKPHRAHRRPSASAGCPFPTAPAFSRILPRRPVL